MSAIRRGLTAAFWLVASVAWAQQTTPNNVNGCIYNSVPPTLASGQSSVFECDSNGNLKITGSFSATTTGFTPNGNYANVTAPSGSSSAATALPAGTVVLFQNTGSNTVWLNLGNNSVSAAPNQINLPASSTIAVTVGGNTYYAAYGVGGTSVVVAVGGSGLPTGWGGGGGGSSGGGNVNITQVGSASYALGQTTMASSQPVVIASNQSAVPISGSVTVSGTVTASQGGAPWSDNVTQFGGSAVVTGTGASGVGIPRVTVSNDSVVGLAAGSSTIGAVNIAPSSSSSYAPATPTAAGSAASSLVLKASAGNRYNIVATCTSNCWLMVFNSTSLPGNGATTAGVASGNLVECLPIAAGGWGSLGNGVVPKYYSVGITAAISSTSCSMLTASTVGFISGDAQ